MKGDPQTIDRSIHRSEYTVVDGKPSSVRFDWRRSGADLHFVPMIRFRFHDELGLAPEAKIRRIGNPDGPWQHFRMGTVQPGIEAVELLGKNHDVAIVRLRDERKPLHFSEVRGLGEGHPDSTSRVGAVGDDVLPFQQGHAWILDAELFIDRKRPAPSGGQEWLRIGGKVEYSRASRQTKRG